MLKLEQVKGTGNTSFTPVPLPTILGVIPLLLLTQTRHTWQGPSMESLRRRRSLEQPSPPSHLHSKPRLTGHNDFNFRVILHGAGIKDALLPILASNIGLRISLILKYLEPCVTCKKSNQSDLIFDTQKHVESS